MIKDWRRENDLEDRHCVVFAAAIARQYHQLAARLVGLYEHITSKALENEKAG
jgi:hypothetical protein